jgi:ATP phosphoribosyltransferase
MRTTVERKLKIGIPKGSLQEATFTFFKRAGFEFRMSSGRSYHPSVDDPELEPLLIRPQEIPRYVEQGILDAGLTGKDWIEDNDSKVIEVAEFVYSKATLNPIRVVLAASNNTAIASVKDLEGKRIATEVVGLTKNFLAKHGVKAQIEFSWGATEVKVPSLVDAIVEGTETGTTLRAHGLEIIVAESTVRDLLPNLKRAGAEGIVEYPLNKVIY